MQRPKAASKIGFSACGAWLKTCGLVFSAAAEMHRFCSALVKVHADLLLSSIDGGSSQHRHLACPCLNTSCGVVLGQLPSENRPVRDAEPEEGGRSWLILESKGRYLGKHYPCPHLGLTAGQVFRPRSRKVSIRYPWHRVEGMRPDLQKCHQLQWSPRSRGKLCVRKMW